MALPALNDQASDVASVRVIVDEVSHVDGTDPESPTPERRRGALVALAVTIAGGLLTLAVTSSDVQAPALEPSISTSTPPLAAVPGSVAVETPGQIAKQAPPAPYGPIHQVGSSWAALVDGKLVTTTDLRDWPEPSSDALTALALDSSDDKLHALAVGPAVVDVMHVVDGELTSTTGAVRLPATPSMGALRGERWIAGWNTGGEFGAGAHVVIGRGAQASAPIPLGGPVESVAIADGYALVATRLGNSGAATESTLLSVFPLDESGVLRCRVVDPGSLLQTPDGVLHFTTGRSAWVVDAAASELRRVLAPSDLHQLGVPEGTFANILPIPSGGGWSVLAMVENAEGALERRLWVSRDGSQLAEVVVADEADAIGHAIWVDQGPREGVGVRIGVRGTQSVLRVWDPRYWHPRPQDLSKLTSITPSEVTLPIDDTVCHHG